MPAVAEADLRERVLDASVALIDEKGLAAFSMREVARRAGVSHQAPYHYFADREEILAAICERGFDELGARVAGARAKGGSAADRFERAALAYVDFACGRPGVFRIMFRPELVDPNKHQCLNESATRAFTLVPEMLLDCIKEGLPPEPSLEALIAMTWSFVHGFASLLLDGALELKLPSVVEDREGFIRESVKAFRLLLDAAIERGGQGLGGVERMRRTRDKKVPVVEGSSRATAGRSKRRSLRARRA